MMLHKYWTNTIKDMMSLVVVVCLKQSIGYQYMSVNRRINFRISFEVMEAFTTNYRKFSYATGQAVSGTNTDLVYGFRLEWILPIYNQPSTEYFYD